MTPIEDDRRAMGEEQCLVCGAWFPVPHIHPAVAPGHCPMCLPLERRDAADDFDGIPREHWVNGVRFSRSAFVMGGEWCLDGTRLNVSTMRVYLDQGGPDEVKRGWPYLSDQQIEAFGLFRSPAPAGPAMRAEEV